MLLDRRRIKRISKWVALFLAVVFFGGSVFLGVGYGTGMSISDIFTGGNDSATQSPEQRLENFQKQLTEDPTNINAMLGIATIYQQAENYEAAAVYLENIIAVDPQQQEVYVRLANLYMTLSDYQATVTVLNKAVSVDPENADIYLKLGIAHNSLGNTSAAVLAWQKYLELAPNGQQADLIREQLAELTAPSTTTTVGASTTTTTGGTTSTTGAGTTTTAP